MSIFSTVSMSLVCLSVSLLPCAPASAQERGQENVVQGASALDARINERETAMLAPSPDDIEAARDLLSQPDTGIIRLMPREVYDSIYGKETALTIRGGGAYYSFATRSQEYGRGSDIGLEGGEFSVGFAGADYGFIVPVGKMSLQTPNAKDARIGALAAFEPPVAEPGAREIQSDVNQGYVVSSKIPPVQDRAPVAIGTTYLLRSVSYDASDVLVAFTAMRQDTDGSVILRWRLLRTFPVPKLEQ